MKKIFLDVGGHRGETLETVLLPKYHFDKVHCFEPIPELYEFIKIKFATHLGGQLQVHNYGLADFTGTAKLYGTGTQSKFGDSLGASLYADKNDVDNSEFIECKFTTATEFVEKFIDKDDFVVLKLNCEGGEVPILQNLMDSGKIHQINFAMIDFDVVKIPSMKSKKQSVLDGLRSVGFSNYIIYSEIGRTLNSIDATKMWLSLVPNAKQIVDLTLWESVRAKLLLKLPVKLRYWIMRRRKKIYRLLGLIPKKD